MKSTEKKVLIFDVLTILFLLLNIFAKNLFKGNSVFILLAILFVISVILFGFEKEKMLKNEKKKIIGTIAFFTTSFLIIIYGLGLILGYAITPYRIDLINIIKNILPIILILVITELLRYNLCHKTKRTITTYVLMIIMFTLIDLLVAFPLYDLSENEEILRILTIVLLPSISKNIMLNSFVEKYGYIPGIIYQLIMNLYIYIIPIYPNLGIYLESVITFLLPLLIKYVVESTLQVRERKIVVERNKKSKLVINILTGTMATIIIVIVLLYSNLTPYWIAIIGSGSMSPTIKVGDAIIIDKTIKDNPDTLKVGDILVFKINDSMYTHRIVEIEKENSSFYIKTKGDREGQVIDNWVLKKENIIGIVKTKIPYIGYPTVLLNRFISSKGE